MNSNAELPRRQSIRLKGYDYTQPGAYFITLVANHRRDIFGHIEQRDLIPSSLGEMVQEEWFRSAQIRREIQLIVDIWQRNYYEHIIRTEKAYQNIWNYIQNNPQRWEEEDRFAGKL